MSHLLGRRVGVLQAHPLQGERYRVQFTSLQNLKGPVQVHVALLGHGLSTQVKSGENAGETLHHEFVVLKMLNRTMTQREGQYVADLQLPKNQSSGATGFSVVFWVTGKGRQTPIQATGGPLPM
jgi:hypothetical protein